MTNVRAEKLETIIYKTELYLKLASLKSPFTCPLKPDDKVNPLFK